MINALTIQLFLSLFLGAGFIAVQNIPTDAKDFVTDELGNIYLIHDTYIERINAVGNGKFRTSELNYGNVEYLDVTNPLKPFIHYRSQGKLIVLDNTLSEQGSVDIYEKGFGQVELVCGSRGDAYWLWDGINSEMIRVDQNFKKLSSTGNLSVMLGKPIIPVQILERGSQLYLRDVSGVVYVFDIYGTYRIALAIKAASDIQVFFDEIILHEGKQLRVIGKDWISEQIFELPADIDGRIYYFNQKLYTLYGGALKVWNKS